MANETIDLLGDGGILKTIITAGTGTRKPQNEDTVVVHYDGTLADGSFVDSSRKRNQKFSFIVGEGKVIQGWELGVPTMKLGEKALFTLQPEYAYGDTSPSENIPINSVVKFEIELFEWFQGENLAGKKNNKGVMYKDISKGGGYLKPKDGESAMISFKGVLDTDDGEVTVVDVKNKSVVVGEITDDVPKAIHLTLPQMLKGGVARSVAKPDFAFGAKGLPPHVTAETPVTFVITLNSWIPQTDVHKDGSVVKHTIRESDGGFDTPGDYANVHVKFRETTQDANAMWVEKQWFMLHEGVLPTAVEDAIEAMCLEEIAKVFVKSKYQDAETETVTGEDKTFEVELLGFKKGKESWDLDNAGRVADAEAFKAKGNEFFKAGKYGLAMRQYKRVGVLLGEGLSGDVSAELTTRCKLTDRLAKGNLAMCQLKSKLFHEAIATCTSILSIDDTDVKALFRRASALMEQGECKRAEYDLKNALLLQPTDTAIKRKLADCKKQIKLQEQKDRAVFAKMLG